MSSKAKKSAGKKGPKSMTKSQLFADLADKTGLKKSQVDSVFISLVDILKAELKAGRPLVIPNLVKITQARKEATKARSGTNPFTGEPMTIKAKPARTVVKVRPVKALKTLV